ncbi:MAG: hypothetical protein LBI61_04060 [Puniceicoccales bacterium]|nr:hypothetical protein [Puniceicoccales bacterium]
MCGVAFAVSDHLAVDVGYRISVFPSISGKAGGCRVTTEKIGSIPSISVEVLSMSCRSA